MPTATYAIDRDCIYKRQNLRPFNRLHPPVWVFDIEHKTMFWANRTAVELWDGNDLEHLLELNFTSNMADVTAEKLAVNLEKFRKDKTVVEHGTFYPEGQPVTLDCTSPGIRIGRYRLTSGEMTGRPSGVHPVNKRCGA